MKKTNRDLYFAIRDLGFYPRIEHVRRLSYSEDGQELNWIREHRAQDEILAKGGHTVCNVWYYPTYMEDGPFAERELVYSAVALCNNKDNYNKKIGVHIALARALEWLQENG